MHLPRDAPWGEGHKGGNVSTHRETPSEAGLGKLPTPQRGAHWQVQQQGLQEQSRKFTAEIFIKQRFPAEKWLTLPRPPTVSGAGAQAQGSGIGPGGENWGW